MGLQVPCLYSGRVGRAHMKLIVQPDAGIAPIVTAIKQAKREHRHPDLPPRSVRDRPRARGGGRPRRPRARADRAHQPRRHQEPPQAGDVAARGGRHRVADRRRPRPLPRQDDDRRQQVPARLRLQLHRARHRQEPQLRRHQQEQAPDRRGQQAVHGRLRPPAVQVRLRALRGQPGQRARAARALHRRARASSC